MANYYYDKLTGKLTTQQYSSDRYGNLIANRSAPIGAVAAAGLTTQTGSTAVQGAGGQQYNVKNYQLAALRGEYGPGAQREAMGQVGEQTGRSIGGNNQPSTLTLQQQKNIELAMRLGQAATGTTFGSGTPGAAAVAGAMSAAASPERIPVQTLRQIAEQQAQLRPGYYAQTGDYTSEAAAAGLRTMAMFGMADSRYAISPDYAEATALEGLRQYHEAAGRSRQAQFYGNELQKTVSRPIELASSYHYLSKATGVSTPANPWELQSDYSVEFLKGKPQKASESFSPVSGAMSVSLPGGAMGFNSGRGIPRCIPISRTNTQRHLG